MCIGTPSVCTSTPQRWNVAVALSTTHSSTAAGATATIQLRSARLWMGRVSTEVSIAPGSVHTMLRLVVFARVSVP